MRQIGCLKARFAKMNLPTALGTCPQTARYPERFLVLFAPLTRLAIEALVCVPTCSDEESGFCPQVLAFDQGVRCFEGEHQVTGVIAIVVLVVMAIAIPILLIKRVQHARNKRNQSLTLKVNEVDKWFNSIDEDGSGSLNRDEVRELLERLGEGKSKSKFERNWEELDQPDENGVKDGVISLEEFSDWYMKRVEASQTLRTMCSSGLIRRVGTGGLCKYCGSRRQSTCCSLLGISALSSGTCGSTWSLPRRCV